jgi:hypothetical protein
MPRDDIERVPAPIRHPARRWAELTSGVVLMIAAPLVSPLPGPAGTLFFAGGMMLVLRNSARARHGFVRMKRRRPRLGALLDRAMRRGSALRRRARDKAAAR